ncbi:MAG: hypothetical protein EB828_00045 [Nitrosopumilus sp. D6]|nr:MAG: hypothetical protein EB828_00045 [Nitrosopumilus sp. D6]
MRLQLQRHTNTAERVSRKAENLMSISAIITAIIVGFYGSTFEMIPSAQSSLLDLQIIIPSLGFMIITIVSCVITTRIKIGREPFLGKELLKDGQKITSWINATEKKYYKKLIEEYVQCLRDAESTIKQMTWSSNISIISFTAGLMYIPIAVILATLA